MPGCFSIGIDFGTESGRAVVVDLTDGSIVGSAAQPYRHGVIDEALPDQPERLPFHTALHDADDYLEILADVVPRALACAQVDPDAVVGIGIDATASSPMLTRADGTPLSRDPGWRDEPSSYVKLWKDHAAQPWANRLNEQWASSAPELLRRYGGTVSSEWLIPKALQVFETAPWAFAAADRVIEVGDWLTWLLTGRELRNASVAGYKACYQPDLGGYPGAALLDELSDGFSALLGKLGRELGQPGQAVGRLTPTWQQRLGLGPIPVAVGNMDAQVAAVAAGIERPGSMLLVMGTSVCNLVVSEHRRDIAGISGVVRDGVLPGFWGYEAGQAGVGDSLNWFVRNFADGSVDPTTPGEDPHQTLLARIANPAQDGPGLVALEWVNGNRSPLVDPMLSGALVGLTLNTRPHHVYRALMEAACFGQRLIIERFRDEGLAVDELVVGGGLGQKNALLMQFLADATGLPVKVTASENLPATGAALQAAVAAGHFASHAEAAQTCPPRLAATYRSTEAGAARMASLFETYRLLYTFFGEQHSEVMHRLRATDSR